MTSILPAHLSDLERDIDGAMARLENITIPIETLWNPYTCPSDVLPYLAWAMSVDTWRSHWPDDIKRAVIAAAPDVHRKKGTRAAVEMALVALGVEVDLIEWWETSPKGTPGTFTATAFINKHLGNDNVLLGADTLAQITEAIHKIKRGSAHYELRLGLKLDGDLNLSGGIEPPRVGIDKVVPPAPLNANDANAPLYLQGSKNTRVDCDVTVNTTPKEKAVPGALYVAGALYQYQTLDFTIG